MKEIFERLGVSIEMWIISFFTACLIGIYRIYEQEEPTSRRKRIRIIIMSISSALLVPGLVVYWMHVENAFFSGAITGLVVYCFELIIDIAKNKLVKKLKDTENGDS